jgi:TolB-like protein/DNA-binding winged helix-turn-helix (wHTH) protein/Tfp pilus assembly protein PilF
MDTMPNQPRLIKFGIFEVDLQAAEIRKAGMKQKLAGQPFQVLQALLEHPQEIVTREELRHRLWPDNTLVDYELALKKAVNRVREVLGDSSDNPRFIQTIPRHGYRFIVSVDAAQRPESVAATAAPPLGRKMPWALASGLSLAVFAALLFAYNFGRLRTRIFAKTRSLEIHSIAVLPLENLSKDPGQDYFSDGITDALTTELAQIGSLRVISRTSSMHFKGTRETLPQIAHELNVDAVVEGTVARSENRVRVTAQLIEASSDRHLWARSYERDLKDVLELQDEVARDIAEEIRVKLKPEERTRLEQARPVNPEALEAYLKGHYYYEKLSTPAFKEAVNYYRQALTRDPDYAPAYVGLAASYKELGVWDALPPQEATSQAKSAIEKALALDNTSGEAHATLGHIHFLWDWDWPGAEREYKRALELGPPSTNTRIQYAVYLSAMGRHDEALAQMREAHAVDPVSHPSNGLLGAVYYWAHRFDEASDQFQKTLALYPDSAVDHRYLGRCYEQKGMYQEALEEYLKEKTSYGATKEELTTYRQAFEKSGMKGFLQEEVKSGIAWSKGHYLDSYGIAELYSRLGERNQAFQWLEKGYQERSHNMAFVKTEPMLDGLHTDPRYQVFLRRMGLPP